MYRVPVCDQTSLDEFRRHVRALISARIVPDDVIWTTEQSNDLFGAAVPDALAPVFAVPSAFVDLARDILCHRDECRFALLYQLLWRLLHGERTLLSIFSDPLVYRLRSMQKAVARDLHKMTAFVRFRKVEDENGERFIAWFEPQHLVLDAAAEFFEKRFANMRWSILTPDGTLDWDGRELRRGPGVGKADAPQDDALEEWWRSYYRATFNPARVNPTMMRGEMPVRYWKNLPEASLIPELLSQSNSRTRAMLATPATLPRRAVVLTAQDEHEDEDDAPAQTLGALKTQASRCQRCPLFCHATQTVFGEGPAEARVAFVGEQPGDQEDLAGRPFVGPAGEIFDRAVAAAGIDRQKVYVTNAVKHFKFEPRGKRRIHQKPNAGEIDRCRWWLDQELAMLRPNLVVALGATAARALTGKNVKVTQLRGRILPLSGGSKMLVTVHPSYLLRLPDEASRREQYGNFVRDLRQVASLMPAVCRAA